MAKKLVLIAIEPMIAAFDEREALRWRATRTIDSPRLPRVLIVARLDHEEGSGEMLAMEFDA